MAKPNDAEMAKLKWFLERLQPSEDYCRPYFDRAKRHYKLWRFASGVKQDDWPYANLVRSRDILAFCEDIVALMIQSMLSTMPFFTIVSRETSNLRDKFEGIDTDKIGKQIEKLLAYRLEHEDMDFLSELVDYFKCGTIYGNGYVGVFPRFSPQGEYLGPMLKTIDFWDCIPLIGTKKLNNSRGVFMREFITLEELVSMQGFYKNLDLLKDGLNSDVDKAWHKSLLQEVGMVDYVPGDEDGIEIIRWFSGGHILEIANRSVIIRDSMEMKQVEGQAPQPAAPPLPYNIPIVQYKYMPVPLEFFAMGIPEVLEVLQEDKNLVRSARRDNLDMVIHKIMKYRKDADINLDALQSYPGAQWPVERLDDIEQVEMGDVSQSSYQEEGLIQRDMENALSLFGYARGMTPQHSEQPNTVMKLQQASLNRLDLSVKLAEFTVLQNIARRVILLDRRFLPQIQYEAIIGDADAGFYRLSEEELARFYYVKPVGSSSANIKEMRQKQAQFAMGALQSVPPQFMAQNIQPFTVDIYNLLKMMLEASDVKNIEDILILLRPMMGNGPPGMPGQPGMPPGGPGGGIPPEMVQALQNVQYGGQ